MNILVFGAGAVGGYLGGLFANVGYDVTLVARGQAAAPCLSHIDKHRRLLRADMQEPTRHRRCTRNGR